MEKPPSHKYVVSAKTERIIKRIGFVLGLLSALSIVMDWYPWPMFFSLPFCLIWVYCGWLHTEPLLKWINVIFLLLYIYGIARYFMLQ